MKIIHGRLGPPCVRKQCPSCKKNFLPDPRVGLRQKYCSKKSCQSRRQRNNEKVWRQLNPDCVSAQRKKWHQKNPEYLCKWRAAHPGSVRRNRELMRVHIRRKRERLVFDKSKEWRSQVVRDRGVIYMNREKTWFLVRLKRASRLSAAWGRGYSCGRVRSGAVRLPRGRLYNITGV